MRITKVESWLVEGAERAHGERLHSRAMFKPILDPDEAALARHPGITTARRGFNV